MTNKKTALEEFIDWFENEGRDRPQHEVVYYAIKLLPKEYQQLRFAYNYNTTHKPIKMVSSFEKMLNTLP